MSTRINRKKSIVSQSCTDRVLERSPVCIGCGAEGCDTQSCDRCGVQICDNCSPDRDDDFAVDLCENCCNAKHDPQHSDGPTWCKRCGTFDDNFEGTPCHEVAADAAWWRFTGTAE